MKTLISCAVAAFFLSACATTENAPASGGSPAAKASSEDYVTGSRLKRSESANENYQGSKSMTGQDYRDYKASTGLKSN